MNPRNAETEIVRPDNEGNYPDNAGNLHQLFSEIAFLKYENRLPVVYILRRKQCQSRGNSKDAGAITHR